MGVKFEWDLKKAALNLSKHGVPFEEALTVFADPLAKIFDDEGHSIGEQREIVIGHSVNQNLLLVCFTAEAESIRIFSAREATKRERKDYEEDVKP
jgi:uncharacterized DUF497 family protein